MKILVLHVFLLCLFYGLSAQGIAEKQVSMRYEQLSLGLILEDLSERYSINFSYPQMDLGIPQSIDFEGGMDEGLRMLFRAAGIEHRWIGDQVVLKFKRAIGRAVKGQVVDMHNKIPLIGATIWVLNSDPVVGASTDEDGYFRIEGLPVGRYDFRIQYLGYEPSDHRQLLVSSGKEAFVEVELRESAMSLGEIVVEVERDPGDPINDMAGPTANSFTVEQTQRFAAAISDPARMVQSYAGVSNGGDDLSNEIVIRGNGSRGLLWKVDGIEVANPNHFGGLGAGGGSVSMLSAATVSDSDFYTGAFPAEFGNALTGVFDMRLRNGNKDKREHSLVIGNLGLEASTEGYVSKTSRASYLLNYRYSTIELLKGYLTSLGEQSPAYRDLTFKLNIPTEKHGLFKLFTLRGNNQTTLTANRNHENWESFGDAVDVLDEQRLGVVGLSHRYLFSDNSYLTTTLSLSAYKYYDLTELLTPIGEASFQVDTIDESKFYNDDYAIAMHYNKKFNAQSVMRAGSTFTHKRYSYDYLSWEAEFDAKSFLRSEGNTGFLQTYVQHQYRISDRFELHSGLHFSYLLLNNTFGIDPRISFTYALKSDQDLSLSLGLHSKPEHASTYFIERRDQVTEGEVLTYPNMDLPMSKAIHLVAGHKVELNEQLYFKSEAYFQYLFDVPVSEDPRTGFSVLNTEDVFDIVYGNRRSTVDLSPGGKGRNYGIELSIEKIFSDGYYYLVNTSLFSSKYAGVDNRWYHTRMASNALFNALFGKEWQFGARKQIVFACNTKFTFYGGVRDNPIDVQASIEAGRQITVPLQYYEARLPPYIRFDQGLSVKFNARETTHTIALDVQNVFNRYNIYNRYYDDVAERLIDEKQNGVIPFFFYRFEFSY